MRNLFRTLLSLLVSVPLVAAANQSIEIGTDIAEFLIFHPDDLAHRAADPSDWHTYSFAYRKESAAGRLVAFSTNEDGGYLIRMTTGKLTATEARYAGASWIYPLIVKHGRVYLDNGNAIPSEENVDDPERFPKQWFSLPNGHYQVQVQAISRSLPGAPESLPDYVVSFSPVDDISAIAIADHTPDLREEPNWKAKPSISSDSDFGVWKEVTPEQNALPRLAASDNIIPGQTHTIETSESEYERYGEMLGDYHVLTFEGQPIGMLARLTGASFMPGRGGRVALSVVAPVAIKTVSSDGQATFDMIAQPDMSASAETVQQFKTKVMAAIQGMQNNRPSHFELERFAAIDGPEAVTSWALMHLPFTGPMKADVYRYGARDRMRLMTNEIEKW